MNNTGSKDNDQFDSKKKNDQFSVMSRRASTCDAIGSPKPRFKARRGSIFEKRQPRLIAQAAIAKEKKEREAKLEQEKLQ